MAAVRDYLPLLHELLSTPFGVRTACRSLSHETANTLYMSAYFRYLSVRSRRRGQRLVPHQDLETDARTLRVSALRFSESYRNLRSSAVWVRSLIDSLREYPSRSTRTGRCASAAASEDTLERTLSPLRSDAPHERTRQNDKHPHQHDRLHRRSQLSTRLA